MKHGTLIKKSTWFEDGRYQLQIPYADQRELLMDIMRYLPEVEVLAPLTLKEKLAEILHQSLQQHQNIK